MVFEPSVAVFDACILYPFHLRNIIVQAAVDRLVEARWTEAIHDEWIRSVTMRTPEIPSQRLERTRQLMNRALPRATVTGYEHHLTAVRLPDPNNRHIVAAAIAGRASLILTWNLRHFPPNELKKYGLERETPDAFLSGLYDRVPDLTVGSLSNARRNLSRTQVSISEFLDILEGQNLKSLAKRIRKHLVAP
jgi:PIN domain